MAKLKEEKKEEKVEQPAAKDPDLKDFEKQEPGSLPPVPKIG